jgi:nucleoside phosphorylase
MFDAWKQVVADLPRPISKHQQRDWLLDTLLHDTTLSLYDIPHQDLEQNAPDWKIIVQDLQREANRYLTDEGNLYDRSKVQKLYRTTDFPYKDPANPRRHIVPMASGSAVHSDNPFENVRTPVRGTVAIDMEGATFYRTTIEFPGIRSLLVKGVSDYADLEKDDSFHAYAARVSSAYLLCFIQEYVNTERIPIGG